MFRKNKKEEYLLRMSELKGSEDYLSRILSPFVNRNTSHVRSYLPYAIAAKKYLENEASRRTIDRKIMQDFECHNKGLLELTGKLKKPHKYLDDLIRAVRDAENRGLKEVPTDIICFEVAKSYISLALYCLDKPSHLLRKYYLK